LIVFLGDGTVDTVRDSLVFRFAVINAYAAAGYKDIAISEAQSALLAARRDKYSKEVPGFEKLLGSLGGTPIESLPNAAEFIRLPPDCGITLLTDQTIPIERAKAVAGHLAVFWGCPVSLWPVNFKARELSFFVRLSEAFDAGKFCSALSQVEYPSQRVIGRIFLTQEKLVWSRDGKNWIDRDRFYCRRISLISEHFRLKNSVYDDRPLALLDAMTGAGLRTPYMVMWQRNRPINSSGMPFAPFTPDVFAKTARAGLDGIDLCVSSRTGAELKKLKWEDIEAEMAMPEEFELPPILPHDIELVQDLSRQLKGPPSEVVRPPAR
jgi:hypothetical protein